MYTMLADSNALRNPAFKGYFTASRNHAVALSDLTVVEMQKEYALSNSRASTAILVQHLDRVFVLKRTDMLLGLRVSDAAGMAALFDYDATQAFRDMCRDLHTVPVPAGLADDMAAAEAQAATIIQRLHQEVSPWEATLMEVCGDFKPHELTEIRTGKNVSDITRQKVFELLKITVRDFMHDNLGVTSGKVSLTDIRDTFAFRYPLAVSLFYLLWVRDGKTTGKRLDRRVNDVIDLQVAALSTFMHGTLGKDGLVRNVSSASRRILREKFKAYVPEDFPLAAVE
jgi:hypothetical protein